MGIHDRDYVRRQPPRPGAYGTGGARGWRTWSVNTWLILTCIAVFVVDGFLPPRLVESRLEWLVEQPERVDQSALIDGDLQKVADGRGRLMGGVRTLYLNLPTGQIPVARQHYRPMPLLESFLHFSTQRGFLKVEFWRLIGFQFLHHHGSLTHILFNMIGLFFFGPMVERYLGSKRYLAFYLLCGICGALLYALLNLGGFIAGELFGAQQVPFLLFNDIGTPLIGASAGVFGVLMAGAYLAPNATVLVFFILPMRLATMAYVLVAIALLTLLTRGANAGGEAGHLGGAIAGFYFIRHPRHLHGFFDVLGRIDPTSHHYRGKGAAVRARAVAKTPGRRAPARGAGNRAEIDRILDKINAKGLQSLTEKEKRLLREASEDG